MDNTPTQGDERGGLDRRAVLRRGAILGGAMMWTVPAVQTLAGPAFAAGTGCVATLKLESTVCTTKKGKTTCVSSCLFVTFEESDACCRCITKYTTDNPGPGAELAASLFCTATGACAPASFATC